MRTNIYVDGFNLFYGALKDRPYAYKWLDIGKLSQLLVGSQHTVNFIRYFSAEVKGRANNPDQGQRQQIYFRALRTIPNLEIHLGKFREDPKLLPLYDLLPQQRKFCRVAVTEEKGSDVNLATYLLLDGFKNRYDSAIVISNDTDLQEPITVVRGELKKSVGVAITNPDARGSALQGDFYRRIRAGNLKASQFPISMTDANGTITRPSDWA
jgi:hypothetical protein